MYATNCTAMGMWAVTSGTIVQAPTVDELQKTTYSGANTMSKNHSHIARATTANDDGHHEILAFWRFVTTPIGFLTTIYSFNIIALGTIIFFFLLNNATSAMSAPFGPLVSEATQLVNAAITTIYSLGLIIFLLETFSHFILNTSLLTFTPSGSAELDHGGSEKIQFY